MGYARKLRPPIVSAAVATIAFTSFATVALVRNVGLNREQLFEAIWPIALTSAAAVILVMSTLYRSLVDLVRELESREAAAQHEALHDQLTGLPNRALLNDRLEQAIGRCRRTGEGLALLILDLDRFKQVNDTMGHHAGDLLVQQVGTRLGALLRETDTVARLGGDEFGIVLAASKSEAEVRGLCARILETIAEPFDIDGRLVRIGASIGAVLVREASPEAAEILRKADITMYRAKSAGRDCFRIFSDDMDLDVQRRDQIETRLRAALAGAPGLDLHYQPQLCRTGKIVGVEALLRWNDEQLGEVMPDELIPVAEESGLVHALGEFIARRACEAARRWPWLSIAINLSPTQFRDEAFPQKLMAIFTEERVPCSQIELEITENLLVEHGHLCARAIQELRRCGFRMALDDFGTGYSSLAYLQEFQVDKIKLDRTFITNASEGGSAAIIRAAVTLGRAMRLEVVAEGVSDKLQEAVAWDSGCDGVQGFLYAPALSAIELHRFLEEHADIASSRAA